MVHLDEATLRALAVKASVHPRTVKKALAGQPIRGLAGHRIRAVLKDAGYLPEDHHGGR